MPIVTTNSPSVSQSHDADAAPPARALSPNRVPVLLHIVDFGDGGIESSLIQWLRVFDRERFVVTLSVMYPSPALANRFRVLVPPDVKIEILADRYWLNYFQKRRYEHRLSKLGRIGRDVFNTLAISPYVRRRVEALARWHALIVDYDMSLRRLANRPRKKRRLATQFARYDGVAALN
ncbi:Alpha-1,4-N-acetylgalactosamine transferase PglH [Candidatus Burkholderia brachyanthoides]|nr:Alpha-1,4-N-acetylgalactosamine transferase PglH [Candidatus Burkholderia brachyanthoides]